MDATLTFSLFFNMLLGPFVSAVLALVRVLELFNVDDCRLAFLEDKDWRRGASHYGSPHYICNIHRWS